MHCLTQWILNIRTHFSCRIVARVIQVDKRCPRVKRSGSRDYKRPSVTISCYRPVYVYVLQLHVILVVNNCL